MMSCEGIEVVEFIQLKEVVAYRKYFIEIDNNKVYKRCRVQLHRRGVKLRDEVLGNKIKTKKQRLCKKNDFIVAEMDAKFGGYGIVPNELEGAIVSSHYYLYEVNSEKLNFEFLGAIIDSGMLQEQIKAVGSTNYSRISAKEVLEYKIPCPPLEKQRQIVSLYGAAKANLIELKTELTHQQALLKKLRQQILQEAIEGKLTAEWRADNPDVEPASKLLARIQAEKARLVKNKRIKAQKPLPPISKEEKPFALPEGWVWCRLGDIVSLLGDGLHGTPNYFKDGEYYFINGNNLINGIIQFKKNTKRVNKDEYLKYKKELTNNTILVSINGTLGNVAFYNNEKIILGKSACYFNILGNLDKSYFKSIIESQYYLDYALSKSSKTTINNLSLKNMKLLPIPLPPFHEQKAIVATVEKLLAFCDQLQAQITNNQTHAEQLMQVVLKEAFSQTDKQAAKVSA